MLMTIPRPILRFPGTSTRPEHEDVIQDQRHGAAHRRGRSPTDRLTMLGLATFVLFVLAAIGSPLWGGSVLAGTDKMSQGTPYVESGLAAPRVQNTYVDDTYDAVIPDTLLFSHELRAGELAAWNPYVLGGVPLGATPTLGVLNPLTLPYYVLPDWLAPGYVKLVEMVFSAAMTFLFLRRLRLGRPAALLGGLLFSSSAFMVVWTNWPHTRTAAFIPAVFWATERFMQRRRAGDAVLVVLALGGMLAGGFPAVTAFTLYTAGPYVLVRAFAEYAGQWRRVAGVLAGTALAWGGAVALLAVQLVPFVANLSHARIVGREQMDTAHISPSSLITALAPWAQGAVGRPGTAPWYLTVNLVESMSYVGAVGVVLVVVAAAVPWAARAVLPRGVWTFLVAALAMWLAALYVGPALTLVQHLPVFSSNFVGRGRSVVGLLVAALAAIGLEVLLRRRRAAEATHADVVRRSAAAGTAPGGAPSSRGRHLRTAYATGVWLGAVGLGLLVAWLARRDALTSPGSAATRGARVHLLYHEVLIGMAFLAVALAAAGTIWWAAPRRPFGARLRVAAAATLPVVAALQALTLIGPYWPRVDRSTFFPTTATHQYLLEHLGNQRFTGSLGAMQIGADSHLKLRSLSGHAFADQKFSDLVNGLPGAPFRRPTYFIPPATAPVVLSPVLDHLAIRYFVASPTQPVIGDRRAVPAEGVPITVIPQVPVTVPLAQPAPLRAITVTPVDAVPHGPRSAAIEVVLRDPAGRELARSRRTVAGLFADRPIDVPIAAEDVPAGTVMRAELRLVGADRPLRLAGTAAATPAVGTVIGGDGKLRLAQAWPAVTYERLTALPRVRWASSAIVDPDAQSTIARVAGGSVPATGVVLDAPGPRAEGRPADVRVLVDDTDEIEARVGAHGAGYLVVADAIQRQWRATIDGSPAPLVPADHGLAAVAVPAGVHTIRLRYAAPYHNLGGWISLATAVTLGVVLLTDLARNRRRPRGGLSSPAPRATRRGGTDAES
jgi:hypothetical protein